MSEESRKLFNEAAVLEKYLLQAIDIACKTERSNKAMKGMYRIVRQSWILAAIETIKCETEA